MEGWGRSRPLGHLMVALLAFLNNRRDLHDLNLNCFSGSVKNVTCLTRTSKDLAGLLFTEMLARCYIDLVGFSIPITGMLAKIHWPACMKDGGNPPVRVSWLACKGRVSVDGNIWGRKTRG